MRWGAFNAAPDASTANWAFRVWTAASRSRSRATNSSAFTVGDAEGITGARAHPASNNRTAAPTSRPFVGAQHAVPLQTRSIRALGEPRIQERDPVAVHAVRRPPRHGEARRRDQRLQFYEDRACALQARDYH